MSENQTNSRTEPSRKRVAVFIEAEEFFNLQKKVFGDSYLSFNPAILAKEICNTNETWDIVSIIVYISTPSKVNNLKWHSLWRRMAAKWRENGCTVSVHDHDLTYALIGGGTENDHRMGKVYVNSSARMHMTMDVMEICINNIADVILFVSSSPLLKPVSDRIKQISHMNKRWLKVVSAIPFKESGDSRTFFTGVPNSDWMKITPEMYEKSIQLDCESSQE